MKFMRIFTAFSLSALALATPEVQGQRQLEVESVINTASISTDATSLNSEVVTKVTSTFIEVTSVGGEAITTGIVESVNVVTTVVTTVFSTDVITVVPVVAGATASVTGSRNAAVGNVCPLQISTPLLAALATTVGGVLFGAWVAF